MTYIPTLPCPVCGGKAVLTGWHKEPEYTCIRCEARLGRGRREGLERLYVPDMRTDQYLKVLFNKKQY